MTRKQLAVSIPRNYEIYTDEENPYGNVRSIRRTSTEPDERLVFSTFAQAKRVLQGMLRAEENELRERLQLLRYNKKDIHKLRVRELQTETIGPARHRRPYLHRTQKKE